MSETTETPEQSETEQSETEQSETEQSETEPITGYGYLTETETAAAIAAHKAAVAKNSKAR